MKGDYNMKRYFVLIAGNNKTFCSLEDALNNGWRIERADNIKDSLVYILYKEV